MSPSEGRALGETVFRAETGGWLKGSGSDEDAETRFQFGYCSEAGCPGDIVWVSGDETKTSFEFTALPQGLPDNGFTQTLIVCAIHMHRGLLPLSETCAMRDVKVLPREAIPDPSEVAGSLANIAAMPTSQALMAAQSAVTLAAGGGFSEVEASEIQMQSLGALDDLLAQDGAGEAVLSSAIEVGKQIGGGGASLDALEQVGDTLVEVASKLIEATGGDPVKTQQLAASTLSTLSSISSGSAGGSSRQSLAQGSKSGASIVDSSRAVKSQLGAAVASGLVPGAGSTVLEADGISMLLNKEYADKASGQTFGQVPPDDTQGGSGGSRRSLLAPVATSPQASMPDTMGAFCSTNPASCSQPLVISLSFTSDSSYLIAGLGQDSFTRALAGHVQGGQGGEQLPANTGAVLISGVFTVEVIGLSQNANIGSDFSLWIPIDGQVAESRAVPGYFCVSMDYMRMKPFVAAEAELPDGMHASCNVTRAGDFVLAQLADLRAQIEELPSYNGPRAGAVSSRPVAYWDSDDDDGGGSVTKIVILFIATLALAALIVCSGWLYVKFWAPYLDVDLEYHLANYDDDEDESWPEHLGASHRRSFSRHSFSRMFRSPATASGVTCEFEDGIELTYIEQEPKMKAVTFANSLSDPEGGIAHADVEQVSTSQKRPEVAWASSFSEDEGANSTEQGSVVSSKRKYLRRTASLVAQQHSKFDRASIEGLAGSSTFEITAKGRRSILTTSLHEAAAEGKVNIINKLTLHIDTFDIDTRNLHGRTPLHLAARAGHVEALHALLRPVGTQTTDVNAQDGAGRTPLHLCVVGGHTEALKVLLAEKAMDLPQGTTSHRTDSPMTDIKVAFEASSRANIGIAESKHGWTALHLAAGRGQEELVHLLVEYIEATHQGADEGQSAINRQDNDGSSALHLASAYGHSGVVKRLLEAPSCSPLLTDMDGWTALHAATSYGHANVVGEILAWSVKAKQSPITMDHSGATPLLLASKRGHVDIVKMILDAEDQVPFSDLEVTQQHAGSDVQKQIDVLSRLYVPKV